ncbi:phosphatidylinositol 4-phosphate 3-kinase C2 domain-containing subunit beta [Polypterus senegalus]
MSVPQTHSDNEQRWGCLKPLGLSTRELVLAEALQMEYDALSRLRQDKDRPALQRGLSGSDPTLNLQSSPQNSSSSLLRNSQESHQFTKEPVYILSNSMKETDMLSKSLPTHNPPPAIPPRIPLRDSDELPSTHLQRSVVPRDVNVFTPEADQPKLSMRTGDLLREYQELNDTLVKLNSGSSDAQCDRRSNRETSGKPVARSKTLPPQIPPRTLQPRLRKDKDNRRASANPVPYQPRLSGFTYELFQVSEERDEEVAAFCHMLDKLRSAYPCTDFSSNAGFVWSPALTNQDHTCQHSRIVKVTVNKENLREPLTFNCDISSTVDLLIYQTLLYMNDDLDQIDVDCYVLKVCGLEEFLQNHQMLGSHEYVQQCQRNDREILLKLMERKDICRQLARMDEDDATSSTMNQSLLLQERPIKQIVTREAMILLLDTFHTEGESFLLAQHSDFGHRVERLVQSVKALCSTLASVETPDITEALSLLPACPCRLQPRVLKDVAVMDQIEYRERVVETLTASILDLVELYCCTFKANFHTAMQGNQRVAPTQEVLHIDSPLSFNVYAAHRIPITWATSYEQFYLSCSLTHGGVELGPSQHTSKQSVSKYLFHLVMWDQRVTFPVQINRLPREAQLTVTLYATPLPPPGSTDDKSRQRSNVEALGWVTMPLFNFRRVLACGRKLLGLWPSTPGGGNARSSTPNFSQPDSVILQVDFPTSSFDVVFSTPRAADYSPKYEFSHLDQDSQRQLQEVLHKNSSFWLTPDNRKLMWEKRYFCYTETSCLPLVLASAPSWEWACLPDIYALLKQWTCMNHLDALGLLHATFPDQEVRHTAVRWMDSISDPELLDFLPQLVQALKYECYLDSPLVRFLLRRAIRDVRVAHYLFWLLKDALQDSQFAVRYQYLLAALLCCSGRGLREEFDRQCWLVNILAKVAQRVREASPSSRQGILREGLSEVQHFFKVNSSCRLPLNPGLLAKGIHIQGCSYFNSNAVPLKLSFLNVDSLGDNIEVIFKSGDDLRQDMLTLQIIRVMNKIWLQEGLNMRMVNFRCFSTGRGRGMVEMIPNAETLRKIQVEHGVTGSFKDRPLADWLQKHNPSEDEYEKAVENFIYSCAGCCVATYILGICDRHNDNIMLRTSGHMFHIDFGKFLGHAQMFGNIKRDRAPFVFTSDMAYVINGGDKPSSRFHDFVDLCCEAYNLIRKHTHLFLNLLGLMLSCGIPELSDLQDLKYVYDALRPQDSEADATMYFTRLIESSLGSVATKLNFFIHSLAQMKFASTEEKPCLSFAPQVHTMKVDGLIKNLFVCGHVKTSNSSKGYSYMIKVQREGQPQSVVVQRSFEEFHELHTKLRLLFPSSKLPRFPSRFVFGRSRGEAVADRRKDELNGYVWHLIHTAPEVAQCDLIYSFFHPLPRDERPEKLVNVTQPKSDMTWAPPAGQISGEVKLSISYKTDKLCIMVMHIRGLPPLQDGADPNPYVKLYLLPDPQKTSKRKTKAARRTRNPTYNEMLVYDGIPRGDLEQRVIHLRVLSEEGFWENPLLGETRIPLSEFDPNHQKVDWYQLNSGSQDVTR